MDQWQVSLNLSCWNRYWVILNDTRIAERETETETERDRERDRQRQSETETERHKETDRETQ